MKCENCDKKHDGNYGSGRFCSKKCARGFSTKEKRKEINKKVSIALGGTGKKRICLFCGKETNNKKFCNNQCQGNFAIKQFEDIVTKTGKFPNKSADSGAKVRKAKRYLITRYGHKCQICGRTEWFGKPMPLWLDHIDGCGDNWKIENIRMVCPNCDFFSDTYCGRNKGKGRRKLKAY